MEKNNIKVGDKVRIIGNKGRYDKGPHHYYAIGDIVEVIGVGNDGDLHCEKTAERPPFFGLRQIVNPRHVELVEAGKPVLFNLDDIKAGYLLEVKRNKGGETFYMTVVPAKYDEPDRLGCCCPEKEWWGLNYFEETTLATESGSCTILRVYGPTANMRLLDNTPDGRELLWERQEEPKVVEMTVAEISEKLGYEVKTVKEK